MDQGTAKAAASRQVAKGEQHRCARQIEAQVDAACERADALPVMVSPLICIAAKMVHLSQDGKVRLVRGKRKHDQICIQAIQTVLGVRVPAWTVALLTDVAHHFVLSFPWHIGIRKNDLQFHMQIQVCGP